jgi:WD40 repeat protein
MITTLGTGLDLYNTKDAVFDPAPGSDEVATALVGGTVKLWATTSPPELLQSLETVSAASSVAFNQSGSELVTTNQTGQTTIWDTGTGAEIAPLNCFCGSIGSAAFDPTGPRMVTGGENGAVDIWDTAPRNLALQDPILDSQALNGGAFLPGSKGRVVVVDDIVDGFPKVEVWNLATDRRLASFPGVSFAVNAKDPDNLLVVNNSTAESVSISGKFKTGNVFTSSHTVSQIAVSSRAQWLGSIESDSNGDSYAFLYNIKSTHGVKLSCPQTCSGAEAESVRFDAPQKHLLVLYDNGALLMWSTAQPHAQPCEFFSPDPGFTVSDAEFDTKGNLVVTADSDGNATIFRTDSCAKSHKGSVDKILNRVTGSINTAQFNPAGTEIVTAGLDGSLTVWNVASGQPIVLGPTPDPTPSAIEAATFDDNGANVLAVGNDGVMRLWSAKVASESLSQLEKTARVRIFEDLTPFQQSLYSAAAN